MGKLPSTEMLKEILKFFINFSHSEFNCELGEDEKECGANGTNEEIIEEIRAECLRSGLHVMCPRTFICISHNWLW